MTTFCNFTPKKNRLIYGLISHNVHLGINPPQKHHPNVFAKLPLKSANYPSPPFLDNPRYILFFLWPNPKNQIFQWNPIIYNFFILNPNLIF